MRMALVITAQLIVLLSTGAASGQFIDDKANCSVLTEPGLYYFSYSQTGSPVLFRVGTQPLLYQPTSRFYFVPSPAARGNREEGAWHIRTQTKATKAPRADAVYVYRPSALTRCSPNSPLPEFSPDDRFVALNSYIDFHAPNNNGRQPNPGLQRYFHFEVQDGETGACIRTDDRRVYGNLADVYGFPDVARTDTVTAWENATSVPGRALAAPASRYEGLSSEFAYRDGENARCFPFTAPLPTGVHGGWFSRFAASSQASMTWHPNSTLVVIKRLRGRNVIEEFKHNISWTQ